MNFLWSDLIDRFRTYVDDDHKETDGWLKPAKRMSIMQVEYRQLYRKWLRAGLINVEPTDCEFVGPIAMTRATVPAFVNYPTYDGVIQPLVNGDSGNLVLLRLDDSGSGTGTLVEEAAGVNPNFPRGDAVFRFQPSVTTFADLEAALASSVLFSVTTPGTAASSILLTVEDSGTTSNGSDSIPGVLAILGVAEVLSDGCYRVLSPMTAYGRKPFRRVYDSAACEWSAFGDGDNLTVKLTPADSQGTYVVRYIPAPSNITDTTLTVELPYMGDERLVLGSARRAGLKEGSGGKLLSDLIMEADAELAFEAAGKDKEGGLVIRDLRRQPIQSTPSGWFPLNPRDWLFY
jgi:hypothetical protein